MNAKFGFELRQWFYFVMLFLLVGFLGIFILGLFIAVPFLEWLLYDASYALPKWEFVKRIAIAIVFLSFFIGTIVWHYEKRSSGR